MGGAGSVVVVGVVELVEVDVVEVEVDVDDDELVVTSVGSGIGAGVVVPGTVEVEVEVASGTDVTELEGATTSVSLPSSSPLATITQITTPTRNTNTTPITAGRFTFQRSFAGGGYCG